MKPNIYEIALAGLLHDIGKIMQRAEIPLSAQAEKMKSTLCPWSKKYSRYTHNHSLWTNDFFQEIAVPKNINRDVAANLASYHHKPSNFYEEIIQLADWCSAGMDRVDDEDSAFEKDKYKKQPMLSPFSSLFNSDEDLKNNSVFHRLSNFFNTDDKIFVPMQPLEVNSKILFPKKKDELTPQLGEKLTPQYEHLFNVFSNAVKKLNTKNPKVWLNSLASALYNVAWCVPSATNSLPDISLYDHSVTTAGIAAALFNFAENSNINNIETLKKKSPFIIIQGDISGIQKYIYNLSSDARGGVHKVLRARSFALSAYAECAAIAITEQLNLTYFNIISLAGGKFLIIAQNTSETEEKLQDIKTDLDNWFYNIYNGELTLNLSYTSSSIDNLKAGGYFKSLLEKIFGNSEKIKHNKLTGVLQENNKWLSDNFTIQKKYSQSGLCVTCNFLPKDNSSDQCHACNSMAKLGAELISANIIEFTSETKNSFNGPLGVNFRIHKNTENLNIENAFLVLAVNCKTDMFGSRFIANFIPKKDNVPLSFEKIAENQPDSDHAKMLGYLRADVDNLGKLFRKGLKNISISRFASVSRFLDLFFTGWLNHKIASARNELYTVYAGGDDLFLIGPWNSIIEFAAELADNYSKFTGNKCTLSAGIAFAKPKLPVHRAAELSGENLENAKNSGRNAINVFGSSVKWNDFTKLKKIKEDLYDITNKNENIGHTFLYRLLEYHRMYKKFKAGYFENAIFISRMNYDFKRNKLSENKIVECINIEAQNQTKLMDNLNVPVMWTIYKTRR